MVDPIGDCRPVKPRCERIVTSQSQEQPDGHERRHIDEEHHDGIDDLEQEQAELAPNLIGDCERGRVNKSQQNQKAAHARKAQHDRCHCSGDYPSRRNKAKENTAHRVTEITIRWPFRNILE